MFSIEKATLADCPLIQTLASNIWEPTYGSILSREQLDYMFEMMYSNESLQKQMSELHHQFFIIYADGVPSGYLSIETVEKDLYEFQKIYSLQTQRLSACFQLLFLQSDRPRLYSPDTPYQTKYIL